MSQHHVTACARNPYGLVSGAASTNAAIEREEFFAGLDDEAGKLAAVLGMPFAKIKLQFLGRPRTVERGESRGYLG